MGGSGIRQAFSPYSFGETATIRIQILIVARCPVMVVDLCHSQMTCVREAILIHQIDLLDLSTSKHVSDLYHAGQNKQGFNLSVTQGLGGQY